MNTLTIKKNDLKEIIKESVREAIFEERIKLYETLIPTVSKKEMNDIETRYGNPKDNGKQDLKDNTEWINK
jgi:hypothetical protein